MTIALLLLYLYVDVSRRRFHVARSDPAPSLSPPQICYRRRSIPPSVPRTIERPMVPPREPPTDRPILAATPPATLLITLRVTSRATYCVGVSRSLLDRVVPKTPPKNSRIFPRNPPIPPDCVVSAGCCVPGACCPIGPACRR